MQTILDNIIINYNLNDESHLIQTIQYLLDNNCDTQYISNIINYSLINKIQLDDIINYGLHCNNIKASDVIDNDNNCCKLSISDEDIDIINFHLIQNSIMNDFDFIAEEINNYRIYNYCPFKLIKEDGIWYLYTHKNNIIENDIFMNVFIGKSNYIEVLHFFIDLIMLF